MCIHHDGFYKIFLKFSTGTAQYQFRNGMIHIIPDRYNFIYYTRHTTLVIFFLSMSAEKWKIVN